MIVKRKDNLKQRKKKKKPSNNNQKKAQTHQTHQEKVKEITFLKISFFSEFAHAGCGIPPFPMEFWNTFTSWTPGSVCRFRGFHKGNKPWLPEKTRFVSVGAVDSRLTAAGTVAASTCPWASLEMVPWSGTGQCHIRPPFLHSPCTPLLPGPALADCRCFIKKNGPLELPVQPSSVTGSCPAYLLIFVGEN